MRKKQNKKIVTFFKVDTGEIVSVGSADLNNLRLAPGLDYLVGRIDDTKYNIDVSSKEPVLKEDLPITIENNKISNLPENTEVRVFNEYRKPSDGVVEIEVDHEETTEVFIINNKYTKPTTPIRVSCLPSFTSNRPDKIVRNADPLRLRQNAYDDTGNQLDSILKIIDTLLEEASPQTRSKIPQEALDTINNWKRVKAKFPKKNP